MPDGLPTLETERLCLRDLRVADFPSVYSLDSDPKVMEFITASGRPLSYEESQAAFEKLIVLNGKSSGLGVWVGELKGTDEFIGLFGLKPLNTNEIEVGYRIKTQAWNKGFATEGAKRLLAYGFSELNLERIVGVVDSPHSSSIKVLKKIGMVFEKDLEILEPRDNKKIIVECYVAKRS